MKRFAMILLSGVYLLSQIGCSASAEVRKSERQAVDISDWSNVFVLDVHDHVSVMLKDSSVVEGRFTTATGEVISVLTSKKVKLWIFEVDKSKKEHVERSNVFRVETILPPPSFLYSVGCKTGQKVGGITGFVVGFIMMYNRASEIHAHEYTLPLAFLAASLVAPVGGAAGCVVGAAIDPRPKGTETLIYEAR